MNDGNEISILWDFLSHLKFESKFTEDMEERVTRNTHVCKGVPKRSRCQLRIRRIPNLKSLIADFENIIIFRCILLS